MKYRRDCIQLNFEVLEVQQESRGRTSSLVHLPQKSKICAKTLRGLLRYKNIRVHKWAKKYKVVGCPLRKQSKSSGSAFITSQTILEVFWTPWMAWRGHNKAYRASKSSLKLWLTKDLSKYKLPLDHLEGSRRSHHQGWSLKKLKAWISQHWISSKLKIRRSKS
jgi:hypothetical protein